MCVVDRLQQNGGCLDFPRPGWFLAPGCSPARWSRIAEGDSPAVTLKLNNVGRTPSNPCLPVFCISVDTPNNTDPQNKSRDGPPLPRRQNGRRDRRHRGHRARHRITLRARRRQSRARGTGSGQAQPVSATAADARSVQPTATHHKSLRISLLQRQGHARLEQPCPGSCKLRPASTVPSPPHTAASPIVLHKQISTRLTTPPLHKDKIDILVNCAGAAQQSLLLRTSEAAIDGLLAANLRSVVLGCRVVGKEMARRRAGGCIINVSSLLAHRPAVGTSVYAAAKAGQLGECPAT